MTIYFLAALLCSLFTPLYSPATAQCGHSATSKFVVYYIYIIYTPNLGLGIAVLVREREQGRFRGSTE